MRIVQDVLIEVLVPDHIIRMALCHRRQGHQSREVHQAMPHLGYYRNPRQGLLICTCGIGAVPDNVITYQWSLGPLKDVVWQISTRLEQ